YVTSTEITCAVEFRPMSLHDALPSLAVRRSDGLSGRYLLEIGARRGAEHLFDAEIKAVDRDASRAFTGTLRVNRHQNDGRPLRLDRKSTRLNSSHVKISHAVFCS